MIAGAGHTPHVTHPVEYAELVTAFLERPVPARAAA
jgi:pimeloyl-ACP methyl ester carboxylesterase